MADQNRNEDQNDEGDSSTAGASTTLKSFSKNSKSKPAAAAAAATAATDVLDGNSTRAENINQKLTDKSMRNLMKQMTLAEQAAASNNVYAPKYDEKAASRQEWKFWQTQPVPTIGTKIDTSNIGPIESNKSIDELRQEPYKLPDGFSWDDIDIHVDEQLQELYTFLSENYIEDDGNDFRLEYSMPFLRWALCVPGWLQKFHVGVRVTKSGKLVGFISAVPIRMRVYDKELSMVDINFLCVHKKLRLKRLSPVLIKEITRRGHLEGFFQAVYTAAPFLPGIASKCRYWHRLLNVKKSLAVKFSFLGRNVTVQQMLKLHRLPESDFDVFNALDIMDNKEFLEKLKFGEGDGNIQYYIYNWKCPLIPAEKVALVLQ
ncbi:unnamed protein product [Rotaria sordida]|uniref:Glycylpeptide N-tetradecanoyltransferase n=1 Tax=Rotaria sordida TaxID=392033 RepID=A0A814T6A5_9BILA|nr:unnamed protein product [Rotaria sordida]